MALALWLPALEKAKDGPPFVLVGPERDQEQRLGQPPKRRLEWGTPTIVPASSALSPGWLTRYPNVGWRQLKIRL
jgi:hypothetical protein